MGYGAVRGSLHVIRRGMDAVSPMEYGLTQADFDQLTSQTPWIAAQRAQVRRTLETLCHATTDLIGLPRFEIPAEYVATVMAVFVHPVNIAVACSWMEGRLPHSDDLTINADPGQGMERLTASQLYALVLSMLGEEDVGPIAQQFGKAMKVRIGRANA